MCALLGLNVCVCVCMCVEVGPCELAGGAVNVCARLYVCVLLVIHMHTDTASVGLSLCVLFSSYVSQVVQSQIPSGARPRTQCMGWAS